ncbi:TPA: transposase [Pseudomonas aeruginosa]|nr:transposase [Pseudomonas aeruginosa]
MQVIEYGYSVAEITARLGVSTHSLYKWVKAVPRKVGETGQRTVESQERLFQVLGERRLLVLPKRAYHKTTQSFHRFYRHPNLLKSGPNQVVPSGPEHVWVADITYLTWP